MMFRYWLTLCLTLAVGFCHAQPSEKTPLPQEIIELQEKLKTLEKELQNQKIQHEILVNKLEVVRTYTDNRMFDYNNLLSAQGAHTTWIGNLVAIVGILITVLVFVGSFATYLSTKDRAKKEARGVAKKWFSEKTHHLEQEIEVLLAKAEAAQQSIAIHADKVLSDAENASKVMQDAKAQAVAFMYAANAKDKGLGSQQTVDAAASEFVQIANENLKSKAEKDFTIDEHYIRGASLYHSGNLQAALNSFDAAINLATDASAADQVKYLMAKAFTLDALNRHEDANDTYDALDKCFGENPSYGVREQVATGLLNKGISYSELHLYEEAAAVYSYLDSRFGMDHSPEVREQVVKALINKGAVLGKLGFVEDEIASYDELLQRFSHEQTAVVREHLLRALNRFGLSQIMEAKANWADMVRHRSGLTAAISALERALGQCLPPDRILIRSDQQDLAEVLGNLGYCLFLSEERQAAKEPTLKCLRMGGKDMLDVRRETVNMSRVEPQDSQYEAMLDELWATL
jgi:tetratricopeptide (TPR) repeat protein